MWRPAPAVLIRCWLINGICLMPACSIGRLLSPAASKQLNLRSFQLRKHPFLSAWCVRWQRYGTVALRWSVGFNVSENACLQTRYSCLAWMTPGTAGLSAQAGGSMARWQARGDEGVLGGHQLLQAPLEPHAWHRRLALLPCCGLWWRQEGKEACLCPRTENAP